MSKDLEDSTEKLLGSQRKGSQLNAAKESKDIFERPKKQSTQTNFDKRCQSLITKQTKVSMTWFGTFLPLDEWLDTNQAQRNGLKCTTRKFHPNDQQPKKSQKESLGMRQTKAQRLVPKDMGNGSTQPINKAWPLKKEAGLNTVMREHNRCENMQKLKLPQNA